MARRRALATLIGSLVLAGCAATPPASPTGADGRPTSPGPAAGAMPTAGASPTTEWIADTATATGGLVDVASTSMGLVAVGYRIDGQNAAVWISADGVDWTAVASPGLDDGTMTALASGPAGLVAVGRACGEGACSGTNHWISADGRSWAPVSQVSDIDSGDLWDVAASDRGYVAGGSDGGASAVYWSIDGRTWQVTRLASPPVASDTGSIAAMSIDTVATIDDGFIAAGQAIEDDALVAGIWRSDDGASWRRVGTIDAGYVEGLAAADGRLVAVGRATGADLEARIWTSIDGVTWTSVGDAGPGEFADVAAGPDGFVVAGYRPDGTAVILASHDGTTWRPMSLPELQPFTLPLAAVARDGGWVAVGAAGAEAASARPVFWHTTEVGR